MLRPAASVALLLLVAAGGAAAGGDFTLFESGHVRPLALAPGGARLFAVNTPDGRLEIFDVVAEGLRHAASVAVGLEPVAVAARGDDEVWVVNHLSDSISVVDVAGAPRVVRTLRLGDEPRDIVFAGPGRGLAFVTAAHRGQHGPADSRPFVAGAGRADVWVFDAAAAAASPEPRTVITLFGDTPRALAATPDGRTVYAAVFLSGNGTTTVPEEAVCDGGAAAPPCAVDDRTMPGGVPWPNADADGVPGPETGLIVAFDPLAGRWRDEAGRDWSGAVRFELPDQDVFAIDAFADPPTESGAWAGVGTVIYDLAVNPVSGEVYAANTEARNLVRLEPRLRGRQHESRLTVIDAGGGSRSLRLNAHLDRAGGRAADSLALPVALAVSADGGTIYLAAHGSARVAVLAAGALGNDEVAQTSADHIEVSGGGPSGLALDEERRRLYVATRFDNGIAVVDLDLRREVAHVRLPDPEPENVRRGRPLLYDAAYTSASGEAACASCHVFADVDALAWDLGDPAGRVEENPLPLLNAGGRLDDKDFHPLKGPMTTQTLQGLATHGAMHWRGDRNGAAAGVDARDERASLRAFNATFVSLLGRHAPLADDEMESLMDFVLAVTPPPNPHRPLDNRLTAVQALGRDAFFRSGCFECHELDPARGRFGTGSASAVNAVAPQFMKVPSLRGVYRKLGRYAGVLFRPLADLESVGPQVRGFGYSHDGSAGRPEDPADAYLLAFDTELAPAVGQQASVGPGTTAEWMRAALLAERSDAGDCELVARAVIAGEERGWLRREDGRFRADRGAESASWQDLRALADEGAVLTFTCVPPGAGVRSALDRDRDGFLDGDERAAGSDPTDPASVPGDRCAGRCDVERLIAALFGGAACGAERTVAADLLGALRDGC